MVIGIANVKTILSEVVTSSWLIFVSSFGYKAKARNEEWLMTPAIWNEAP